MRIHINNIDELIEAYKDDVINTSQLLDIIQNSFPKHIAMWSNTEAKETKETHLKSLRNYKIYLEAGCEFPFFWPFLSDDPTKLSFNDCLSRGKDQ